MSENRAQPTGQVLDATERITEHAKRGKGITLSKEETKIVAAMLSQFDVAELRDSEARPSQDDLEIAPPGEGKLKW